MSNIAYLEARLAAIETELTDIRAQTTGGGISENPAPMAESINFSFKCFFGANYLIVGKGRRTVIDNAEESIALQAIPYTDGMWGYWMKWVYSTETSSGRWEDGTTSPPSTNASQIVIPICEIEITSQGVNLVQRHMGDIYVLDIRDC